MSETPEQELARLRAENAALREKSRAGLTFKISAKGGISVYGLGRWPVTLYRKQWLLLQAHMGTLQSFMTENEAALDRFEKEFEEGRNGIEGL